MIPVDKTERRTAGSCKIKGLLFASLDANEQFHSRSRCCPCCRQREIEVLDDHGFHDEARNRNVQLWAVQDLSFTEG